MTQEDKQLLLVDLCGRLPYGVKFRFIGNTYDMIGVRKFVNDDMEWVYGVVSDTIGEPIEIELIKPYLRPMSSMTEDEKNELKEYLDAEEVDYNGFGYSEGGTLEDYISSIPYSICSSVVDWLNKKMFDYRGLIPLGSALEAPEGMYNN